MTLKYFVFFAAVAALSGCSQDAARLVGDRETLAGVMSEPAAQYFISSNAPSLNVPKSIDNSSWTHRGGNAQHNIAHPALGANLTQIWTSPIGEGEGRRHEITASPVVSSGRVFTLDSRSTVTATSTSGQTLWQMDLTSSLDDRDDASGGGLAVSAGRLFVTTGFGTVSALDVETGNVLWTQDLISFGGAAPTVYKNILYIAARDGSAWAINVKDGTIKWQISGPTGMATHVGGPGVAVTSKWAIFPFDSGEVYATFRRGGLRNWTSVLSGARLGQAVASINDLTGDPVVSGNRVYLANSAGRTAALSLQTGERIWTANHGAKGDIWVAGNAVFAVDDLNNLIRLDTSDGQLVWSTPLPRFTTERVKRRKTVVAHFGPVLAGGRLILTSSDGQLRQFDPSTGILISERTLDNAAAVAPVVAGGTLYSVDVSGHLVALRSQ